MKILFTKLRRDIGVHKYQFAAVFVVVLLGIGMFGASYDSYQNLLASYDKTHVILNFADYFFSGGPYTEATEKEVEGVDEVKDACARVVSDIPVKVKGNKIEGRVVGIPKGKQPKVNKLKVISGEFLKEEDSGKVLLEKHFAEYYKLKRGDTISVWGEGKWNKFEIAGVAISPEYIWPAKSRQDVIPTPENFGVLFMQNQSLQKLNETGEVFNEIVLTLDKGANKTRVRDKVEDLLKPHGLQSVLSKEDQPSNDALNQDLEGFNELSAFFPLLFLTIAALSIYIMLTRMVHAQRPQIGILRATGFSRRVVEFYYLSFGFLIAIFGSIIGIIIGMLLARWITELYTSMLSIPVVEIGFYPATFFTGIIMALVFCFLAGWAPARGAAKIQPAQAMRGETPQVKGRLLLMERIVPLFKRLPPDWKIPIRGIGRNKRRSLYTILGIVFALVLIMASWGMLDTINILMEQQFKEIQKDDMRVVFKWPVDEQRVKELENIKGVKKAEPVIELPVSIKKDGQRYSTLLTGFERDTKMHTFLNQKEDEIKLPTSGILVGEGIRTKLDIDKGDIVEISITGMPLKFKEEVIAFLYEPMGTFAYADINRIRSKQAAAFINASEEDQMKILKNLGVADDSTLAMLQSQGGIEQLQDKITSKMEAIVTSSYVTVAQGNRKKIRKRLENLDDVSVVIDSNSVYDMMKNFMTLFYLFVGIMLAFGGIMAFALIFNTMTVNIVERRREIATLRTLGFRRRKISVLVTVENLILAILGIVPGLFVGYYTSYFAFQQWTSDLFTFQFKFYPMSYVWCSVAIIIVALLSQVPALRSVNRLDITRIIKERTS